MRTNKINVAGSFDKKKYIELIKLNLYKNNELKVNCNHINNLKCKI